MIKILGTKGEIEESSPGHTKQTGILVDGVLLDCGEEEFLNENPKAIIISHLHPDHSKGLKALKKDIPVYIHPESLKVKGQVKVPSNINFKITEGPIKINNKVFIFHPVSHSINAPTFAIKSGDLLFASDVLWFEDRNKAFEGVTTYIADGSTLERSLVRKPKKEPEERVGHASVKDQIKWCIKYNVKNFILQHLGKEGVEIDKTLLREKLDTISEGKLGIDLPRDGEEIKMSNNLITDVPSIEPVLPKVIAKVYSCPICSEGFPTIDELKEHVKEVHPEVDWEKDILPKLSTIEREPRELAEDKPKKGLYLVVPHGRMIAEGEKTIIVKSKRFEVGDKPFYLIEDKLCWGIIKLRGPEEVNYEKFDKNRDKHKVTDEEAFKRWGWRPEEPLYFYYVKTEEIYDPPKPVKIPQGVQTFVDSKNIEFLDLKTLTQSELEIFHAYSHGRKLPELHELLLDMLNLRLIPHFSMDELDREHELLIADWKSYDPKELIQTEKGKKVLADDHRIVHAWANRLKKGKALKSEQFKEYSLTKQKQIVKNLHDMIVEAFKELGWEHETPMELALDVENIKIEDLETIDDILVKELTDEDLKALDERLHELFKELGKVTEPLANAHIFTWKEMIQRDIEHDIDDKLTEETALEVIEYPTPRGFASAAEDATTLKEVLEALPDRIILHEPPCHAHLVGRVVNEGIIPKDHDIDILFKQSFPDTRIIHEFLKEVRAKNPDIAKRLHFVFDPYGPQIGFSIPVYNISYSKIPPNEMVRHSPFEYLSKETIKLGTPWRSLKTQTGFNKFEFFEAEDLWLNWASGRIEKGIILQKKYDGMRFQVHKMGNQIKIITEDRQRDRASVFKKAVDELKAKVKVENLGIDTEMVEYNCEGKKVKDKEEICEALPREEMIPWVTSEKMKLDDENIVFHIHDCLWFGDQALNDKPYKERLEFLKKAIPSGLEHWRIVSSVEANDKKSFETLLSKVRHLKGSEGAMLKVSDSIYKLTGRTSEWAKIKNLKEIDVMIWEVIQKKSTKTGKPIPGQYMYDAVFQIPVSMKDKVKQNLLVEYQDKYYLKIGRTYSTSIKGERGDILTVRPIRIAEVETEDGKLYWTWMFPLVDSKHPVKKEPDTINTVRKLVKIGTAPLSAAEESIKLRTCPFWSNNKICPLKERFAHPMDNLSKIVLKEFLKFPVACPHAFIFKCRFVKPYYYDLKQIELIGEDLSEFDSTEEAEDLGRLFGSPTFDDHMLDALSVWEKSGYSEEKLKEMQVKGNYQDVVTDQNDYFEMFALKTASIGVKLPHILLNDNWYMDQAAQMIVDSHLGFYPDLKNNNPYPKEPIEGPSPNPKQKIDPIKEGEKNENN